MRDLISTGLRINWDPPVAPERKQKAEGFFPQNWEGFFATSLDGAFRNLWTLSNPSLSWRKLALGSIPRGDLCARIEAVSWVCPRLDRVVAYAVARMKGKGNLHENVLRYFEHVLACTKRTSKCCPERLNFQIAVASGVRLPLGFMLGTPWPKLCIHTWDFSCKYQADVFLSWGFISSWSLLCSGAPLTKKRQL